MDLVFSNLVLELVPEPVLVQLFTEAARILRSGGYMFHLIDLGDQFASGDSDITAINFLQYSESEFTRYNSAICYQNRLRAPVYRKLIEDSGFEVITWKTSVDERSFRQLRNFKIHADFRHFDSQELCTTSVTVLAKKL